MATTVRLLLLLRIYIHTINIYSLTKIQSPAQGNTPNVTPFQNSVWFLQLHEINIYYLGRIDPSASKRRTYFIGA